MSKKIIFLVLLISAMANAQIVNIPDPIFKGLLLSADSSNDIAGHQTVDTDADGEISVFEASAITSLMVMGNVFDFTGIEAFGNIQTLWISGTSATAIPTANLTQLIGVILDQNVNLTSFDLTPLVNLQTFQASSNDLLGNLDLSTVTNMTYLELAVHPAMTSLDVSQLTNLTRLVCNGNYNITNVNFGSISGVTTVEFQANQNTTLNISGLVNLQSLSCGYNTNLTSLDLSGLNNLTYLDCRSSGLSNLDLSPVVNLTTLNCSQNLLGSLDLSNNPNLTSIDCSNTNLTSLDLTNQDNLNTLRCGNNPLTTLDVTGNPLLTFLEFSNTGVTTIDLTNNLLLVGLGFSNTNITEMNWIQLTGLSSLACANTNFPELDLSAFTNLNILNCGGSALTRLFIKNGKNENLNLADSPNLEFICADDTQVASVQTQTGLHASAAAVSSYCSFTPGGNYNTITGKARLDQDNNGCDSNDLTFPFNLRINMTGAFASSTFLNATGDYTLYALTGDYTLTPVVEYPDFFNVSPASATVNFPFTDDTETSQNFCITPNGYHPDLEVMITPLRNTARPGFDALYKIIYRNKGNQIQSGQVNLSYNDAILDLVSASPPVDNLETDLLSWNFAGLQPFESRNINLTLNVNSPVENPPVNLGDILGYTAQITNNEGEETPSDNTFHVNQGVTNSYDPNDKTCLEGSNVLPENIGKFLHYNINFENTGTAEAINIVVKDTIDTTRFDINTLQLQYASHPAYTKITGNVVEFIFENINLPPSSLDPIGGHGNVLFKIKTLPTLTVGDEVSNTANIFFDYNHPIDTNEARTAFNNLAKTDFVKDSRVTVYPNPVKNKVTVKAQGNIKSVGLYDSQGRILQSAIAGKNQITLDLSSQQTGVYFLTVTTQKGSSTQKIVKQ